MEMKYYSLLLLLTMLLVFGCASDETPQPKAVFPEELINTWVASHEEGAGVYRPSDYKEFPTSWFRQTYTFKKEGSCDYLMLSPMDAHTLETGTWAYDSNTRLIRIYHADGSLFGTLQVTAVTAKLLEVKE